MKIAAAVNADASARVALVLGSFRVIVCSMCCAFCAWLSVGFSC
jgi:hypothetical protein